MNYQYTQNVRDLLDTARYTQKHLRICLIYLIYLLLLLFNISYPRDIRIHFLKFIKIHKNKRND